MRWSLVMASPDTSPVPAHSLRNFPLASNTSTRWLSRSVTYTLPCASVTRLWGSRNSPGPVPLVPHCNRYFPSREYFTTRALPYPSLTYTSPLAAKATSVGRLKVLGPVPDTPLVPRRMISFRSAFNL